jgi:hypothetical protein
MVLPHDGHLSVADGAAGAAEAVSAGFGRPQYGQNFISLLTSLPHPMHLYVGIAACEGE